MNATDLETRLKKHDELNAINDEINHKFNNFRMIINKKASDEGYDKAIAAAKRLLEKLNSDT
jgi:hypothetical protein